MRLHSCQTRRPLMNREKSISFFEGSVYWKTQFDKGSICFWRVKSEEGIYHTNLFLEEYEENGAFMLQSVFNAVHRRTKWIQEEFVHGLTSCKEIHSTRMLKITEYWIFSLSAYISESCFLFRPTFMLSNFLDVIMHEHNEVKARNKRICYLTNSSL